MNLPGISVLAPCEFYNEIVEFLTLNHMNFMVVKTRWFQNVKLDFGTSENSIMKLMSF